MDYSKIDSVYQMLNQVNQAKEKKVMNLLSKDGEMTVKSIAARLKISQDQASSVLMNLRKAQLVNYEQEGRFVYYSVNWIRVNQINEATAKLSAPCEKYALA